nr:zinc finger protein 407 [Ipomoea batatas]
MKTVRGLVELVTVEVWAVGGEMNESFGEDSSYDGEIDDSDCGFLDDLDYEINIDPNVEYCGEDHHVISKDGQHLNRVHVKLHCTLCKKEGHNRRKCPLNPTLSNRQNNPRRKSTTKKQGPTCSSASQVDPSSSQAPPVEQTSSQAPPVDQTSSQAPPVDQTSSQAPPVDQTSSPSDAHPAGMEDDISDQMLADLDIDAFVSNLIDGSGIGSGQQQQAPQVQWRFSMYTVGGRGSSGATDGSAMTLDHEHQGPEEIEVHTNSTQPPANGDEDTQAERDDDNAKERPNPCHKAKKIKVIKNKHVVNGRKYETRARFAALKAKFPPTSADSPFNVD